MIRRLAFPLASVLFGCAFVAAALRHDPSIPQTAAIEPPALTGVDANASMRHVPQMDDDEEWQSQWVDVAADSVLPDGIKIEITKGVITGVSASAAALRPDVLGTRYVIGDLDATDVTEELWRNVSLTIARDDGSQSEIHLARPLWWLSENYVKVGGELYLALYEMGIEGIADVVDISPLTIEQGPASKHDSEFVTGTFKHNNSTVWNLVFDGDESNPLGVTANHPIFSDQRNEWVPAAELELHEKIRTIDGAATLTTKSKTAGTHTVYNLEVHRSHTFHVHDLGILVHNTCAGNHHFFPRSLGSKTPYGHSSLTYLNQADHTRLHQSLNNFLRTKTKTLPNGRVVDMLPRRGNAGAIVQNNFTKQERLKSLVEFHRGFDRGKHYKSFLAEIREASRNGWVQ